VIKYLIIISGKEIPAIGCPVLPSYIFHGYKSLPHLLILVSMCKYVEPSENSPGSQELTKYDGFYQGKNKALHK
jgi:hypothetical protein